MLYFNNNTLTQYFLLTKPSILYFIDYFEDLCLVIRVSLRLRVSLTVRTRLNVLGSARFGPTGRELLLPKPCFVCFPCFKSSFFTSLPFDFLTMNRMGTPSRVMSCCNRERKKRVNAVGISSALQNTANVGGLDLIYVPHKIHTKTHKRYTKDTQKTHKKHTKDKNIKQSVVIDKNDIMWVDVLVWVHQT